MYLRDSVFNLAIVGPYNKFETSACAALVEVGESDSSLLIILFSDSWKMIYLNSFLSFAIIKHMKIISHAFL